MAKAGTFKKGDKISGKVDAQVILKASNGFPEVGQFTDEKSLQKFYKQLDTPTIEQWVAVDGLEFKAEPTSPAIHRMRACMAILYNHFPRQTAPKKASPYKDFTTEALVQMALDHEVPFEVTADERILRMRAIMALRAAKVIG